ncbi:MAG: Glyoxylase, beta-lactamase superfamily [Streptosporangiaceae bacterium]|nr:Glyoxylase, beta-lactamase superfamily [Streptosporangiaceae bacterium]
MSAEDFAVYALKFAHRDASVRGEHFYGHDPCALDAYPISYYVWLMVRGGEAVLLDAGFTPETAVRRGHRHYLQSPMETIEALGVGVGQVSHVVLSHLHYDHVGHVRDFPAATVVLQEAELGYWTSRHAGRGESAHLVEPADIAYLVERNLAGRVRLVNGVHEVLPGLTAHRLGGHTPGLQVVRVRTRRGQVVLAADGSHFYENIERDRPYAVVNHLPSMYEAFDSIRGLADGPDLVVPGHDPRVMDRYPPVPGLEGIAVRIA